MTLDSTGGHRSVATGRELTRFSAQAQRSTLEDAVIDAVTTLVSAHGQDGLPTATDLAQVARYLIAEARDRGSVLPGLGLRPCRLTSSLTLPATAVEPFLGAGETTGSIGTCRFSRFADAITATSMTFDVATIVVVAVPSRNLRDGTPSDLAAAAGDKVLTVREAREHLRATTDGRWVQKIAAIATDIALANPHGGYSDVTLGPRQLAPDQRHATGWDRSPLKPLLQEVFHALSRRHKMPETLWTRTAAHPRLRSGWTETDQLVVIKMPPAILDRSQRIEAAEAARSRLIAALKEEESSPLLTHVEAACHPGSALLEERAAIENAAEEIATSPPWRQARPRIGWGRYEAFLRPARAPTIGEIAWWAVIDEDATLDDLAALKTAGFADVRIEDPAIDLPSIDQALQASGRKDLAEIVERSTTSFYRVQGEEVDDVLGLRVLRESKRWPGLQKLVVEDIGRSFARNERRYRDVVMRRAGVRRLKEPFARLATEYGITDQRLRQIDTIVHRRMAASRARALRMLRDAVRGHIKAVLADDRGFISHEAAARRPTGLHPMAIVFGLTDTFSTIGLTRWLNDCAEPVKGGWILDDHPATPG